MVPPTLLTTVSSRPNSSYAACGQAGDRVEVAEVGRDDERASSGARTSVGDGLELVGGARGDHHVGAGLGERDGGGGADARGRRR